MKYYIFSPCQHCSGGPEALHQLRYYMEKKGLDVSMVYWDACDDRSAEECIPARYLEYFPNEKKVLKISEYHEKDTDTIIVPEVRSQLIRKYKKAKKAFGI